MYACSPVAVLGAWARVLYADMLACSCLQASAQRERELVSAIEDSDTRLSRQLAALTAMETRATSAEDSARGSAAEAAQYK